VSATPNPNLGGIVDMVHPVLGDKAERLGIYKGTSYMTDVEDLPLAAALHVETCVGQVDGGAVLDTVAETRFVLEQAKALGKPCGVVAFVQLGREDAADVLAAHASAGGASFRGVRMILNFSHDEPSLCWPQVGTDAYLKGTHDVFNKKCVGGAAEGPCRARVWIGEGAPLLCVGAYWLPWPRAPPLCPHTWPSPSPPPHRASPQLSAPRGAGPRVRPARELVPAGGRRGVPGEEWGRAQGRPGPPRLRQAGRERG
jgi:hypothetical protein